MGQGCFIVPDTGALYAPCNGKILSVFPTKHAYVLVSNSGVEIIIHIGVDTVNLNGELFDCHVKKDQKIKKGDLLVTFDLSEMLHRKIVPDIFIVFPKYTEKEIGVIFGKIRAGDKLIEIVKQ